MGYDECYQREYQRGANSQLLVGQKICNILWKNGNDFFFSFFWVKKQFETKRMNTSQLDKAGERGERREERWGGEDYKQKESLPPFIDSTNSDRASAVLNEESTNPAFLGLPF